MENVGYSDDLKILAQELLDLDSEKPVKISKKVKKLANKIINGDKSSKKKLEEAKEIMNNRKSEKVNMTDPDSFASLNKKKVYESLL